MASIWNGFIAQSNEGAIGNRAITLQVFEILRTLGALAYLGNTFQWISLLSAIFTGVLCFLALSGSCGDSRNASRLWFFMVLQLLVILFSAFGFIYNLLGLGRTPSFLSIYILITIFIDLCILWLAYLIRTELLGNFAPSFFSLPTKRDLKDAAYVQM